jgi:hypothetical protein
VSKWRYSFIQEILSSCFPAEVLPGSFSSAVPIYVKKSLFERNCALLLDAVAFLFFIVFCNDNKFVSTANVQSDHFAGPRNKVTFSL